MALKDLKPEGVVRIGGNVRALRIVTAIGKDVCELRKTSCNLVEKQPSTVTVLQARRMDDEASQQAKRIDEEWILRPIVFLSAGRGFGGHAKPSKAVRWLGDWTAFNLRPFPIPH